MNRVRRIAWASVYPMALLLANYLVVRKMFGVEYSAHLGSNEGTFIAIARQVAADPWSPLWNPGWFPWWECGLPFVNTYLPLLQLITGWFSLFTGHSPALSFHQVCAALYCLGPVGVYALSVRMTGNRGASFLAALAYSAVSPCAWLVPSIRSDVGGWWELRRLQVVAFYGEGPHTASMAALPWAMLFLWAAAKERKLWLWVLAGAAMGVTILFNAFGAVILGLVGLSLLGAMEGSGFWRLLSALGLTGALTYAWISTLAPPSVIAAIRANSPTVDGDFRFTARSMVGVVILAVAFGMVRWGMRRVASEPLRFFALLATLTSGIVLLGTLAQMYVVPQPHRYQLALDLAWCMLLVLAAVQIVPARWHKSAAIAAFLLLLIPLRHNVRSARGVIQGIDMTATSSYRVAQWIDANLEGRRVMMPGSYSFQFNDFSNTPQVLGGHDPMLPNLVMRIAGFVLYSGFNAGDRDGAISVLWLRALGAHAVVVPGPTSQEVYKPFARPGKFEGLLPVLWRDAGDTVYGLPSKSTSLAHVIPASAALRKEPIHGLDVGGIETYVQALDDASLADAPLTWQGRNHAEIRTTARPTDAISVQVTYHPGWHATVNGTPHPISRDGLGLMLIEPACNGACSVVLDFDGGLEASLTHFASAVTLLLGGVLLWGSRHHRIADPKRRVNRPA